MMASREASSAVKRPVIWASPPEMRSWTTGAEITTLSSTMAICFPTRRAVASSKSFAPSGLKESDTPMRPSLSGLTEAVSRSFPDRRLVPNR